MIPGAAHSPVLVALAAGPRTAAAVETAAGSPGVEAMAAAGAAATPTELNPQKREGLRSAQTLSLYKAKLLKSN